MQSYLPYDLSSTIRVEEQVSVRDNKAFLRHIPKKGSVLIDDFTEVDGAPIGKQFYCDYATDSLYRDANRVLHFGSVDDFTFLTVSYVAIGTVVTADDMNEIKAHLENESIHGAADNFFHDVGDYVCFPNVSPSMSSWSVADYEHDFQDYAGRPSKEYDVVSWVDSGSGYGWAIRIGDKWVKLSAINGYSGSDTVDWFQINPLLSVKDRQKLDNLFEIGDGFYRTDQADAGTFSRDMADQPVLNSRALFQAFKRFPMDSYDIAEGVNQGYFAVETLEDKFVLFVKRGSRHGDLISFYQEPNSGGFADEGWAFRTNDKWIILDYYKIRYDEVADNECWGAISPFLSVKDRQKLDGLVNYQFSDSFYLQSDVLNLQTATQNTLGGVKVGDGLQVNNSAALCLKAATASQLGGIKIGDGLVKDLHEVLSVEIPLTADDRQLLDRLHQQSQAKLLAAKDEPLTLTAKDRKLLDYLYKRFSNFLKEESP